MIRPVSPDDLPALSRMLQALADHDGGGPVASEAVLRRALFGPRPLIKAVIHPLGMAIYHPDFSTHRGLAGLCIQDLYVAPDARGQGLGRALLRATLAHQDWGAAYLTLGVAPDNAAARRFYARAGFRPRGYETLILTDLETL